MIQLHCFAESGHSYKVALALELSGLEWEPVFVDFFNGEARSAEYKDTLNSMAEAPVFVDGDLTLTQSGVILDHISKMTGKFGGETPEEARDVLRWVLWDNHKMSSNTGVLRFQMNFLSPAHRSDDVIAFLKGRQKVALSVLEKHLTQRDWMVGRGVTNADFSCCSYLFYNESFDFDRSDWPAIDAWLTRIEALPGWKHPFDLMEPAFPKKKA